MLIAKLFELRFTGLEDGRIFRIIDFIYSIAGDNDYFIEHSESDKFLFLNRTSNKKSKPRKCDIFFQ